MAGPRTCRSSRRNLLPGGEDKLWRGPSGAPTKDNNTPTPSPAVSRAQTSALTLVPAFALVSALAPALPSTKELFQLFIKVNLENQNQNQNQALPPASIQAELWEQLLKAQFLDLYYENSHLDCYAFASSMRTTLTLPKSTGLPVSHLPPYSSMGQLYSIGININVAMRGTQWRRPNSRIFSERTWEIIGLLLIISVVNSDKTLNIKPSLCWIGLLTWNTCSPSCLNTT